MLDLFVDIDMCPVFPQILQVAQRHLLDVYVVSRDYLDLGENVHLIVAQEDGLGTEEWIAANVRPGDICITADGTLAALCRARFASVIGAAGGPRVFTERLEAAIASARATQRRESTVAGLFASRASRLARP
jgi:uncharacterized protein YaiI (UPF0178 family)